ncbi:MAG: plsB [Panacagrimonas sp.]|jgi:glycerol-3-phosphate O-acyltransferase|nr:glycerol-3-phosphate 1-O-acyltransferase PlsB [Panacagrimonas sp.]MCC2658853.1 plsB [Panacagrimonas sp.]
MSVLYAAFYWIAWWLFRPLNSAIRYRVTPDATREKLALDPDRPVVYVLPARSWGDLFVLDRICREQGLPVPRRTGTSFPAADRPGVLYLPALLETRIRQTELSGVVEGAAADPTFDAQVVPVSVYWGRDPGQETSLWKLLFADSVQAGMVRKLFIMLVNSRNVYAAFAEPLNFREFVSKENSPEVAVNKMGRLLHLYFLRARTAALGPRLQTRRVVMDQLLASQSVKSAIEQEARDSKITLDEATRRARKCADEIAANYSSATVRFLELIFRYVWNRVFRGVEVHGMDRLREWAQNHEMVYLPSHRSHADYLLVSYVLYQAGLVPPHIAAGVNLNFWPVGGLLRRAGAFYIRRSFSGDRLYTAVFRAYVDALIARGYSISYYPEGTRSRTGRLLSPKTGMLGMVVESSLRQTTRKVALVPVFICYDKVWELNSYFKELRGGAKKKESAGQLLKAGKLLTKSFGKVHINFGEPLLLQDYADKHLPNWREALRESPDKAPSSFKPFVQRLALANHRRINAAAVASPVGLTALALLASPERAISQAELIEQVGHLIWLLKGRPYSETFAIPEASPRAAVEWAIPIVRVVTVPHAWGDLYALADRDAVLLTYARNNLQHLFALPSLVANFFRTRSAMPDELVITGCRALYPFLRTEFFVRWETAEAEDVARQTIDVMLNLGLLARRPDGWLMRPEVSAPAFSVLSMLGRVMGETLERYCMTTWLLAQEYRTQAGLARAKFEEDCRLLAERMAVLTGRDSPEFFDKTLFRGYLDTLIDVGLVRVGDEQKLVVDERILKIAERSLELLSDDSRQTLLQLISRRPATAATGAVQAPSL